MADSDLLITISGAALSLLFYENVRNKGDQMGFLLGDTLEFVLKSYTDSDNQIETVKIHNNIETVVTCPLQDLLANSAAKIDRAKLKEFMHDQGKQVIGWFRFRRYAALAPTMKDKLLHKEFASYFSRANGSKEEFFVTCLLNASMSNGRGTHKFKHVFLQHKNGRFEPVPLRIYNLGNNSCLQDDSDYKPTPTNKSSDVPDVFTRFVDSLNLNLARTSELDAASTIQSAAEQYLTQLIPELCESDLEVEELERQIREFKQCKNTKMNGTSNNKNRNNKVEKESVLKELQRPERIVPQKLEIAEDVCENSQMLKDCSATSSQTRNEDKPRWTNANVRNNVRQKSPPLNSVSNMKLNVTENMVGVGRGLGKISSDTHQELKTTRRTSGPPAMRTNSERTPHTQVMQQESSDANCVQNATPLAYNQVAKKKVDNTRKSNSTDSH